jgi:hypothetical protein
VTGQQAVDVLVERVSQIRNFSYCNCDYRDTREPLDADVNCASHQHGFNEIDVSIWIHGVDSTKAELRYEHQKASEATILDQASRDLVHDEELYECSHPTGSSC